MFFNCCIVFARSFVQSGPSMCMFVLCFSSWFLREQTDIAPERMRNTQIPRARCHPSTNTPHSLWGRRKEGKTDNTSTKPRSNRTRMGQTTGKVWMSNIPDFLGFWSCFFCQYRWFGTLTSFTVITLYSEFPVQPLRWTLHHNAWFIYQLAHHWYLANAKMLH